MTTTKVNVLLLGIMLSITLGCGGGGYQGDGGAQDLGQLGSYGASENSQDSTSDTPRTATVRPYLQTFLHII